MLGRFLCIHTFHGFFAVLSAEFPHDQPTIPGKVISCVQIAVRIGYIRNAKFVRKSGHLLQWFYAKQALSQYTGKRPRSKLIDFMKRKRNASQDEFEDDDLELDLDEDGDDEGKQKPSGGGIILVPRAEPRRDHRGMARVTTIIGGDRKRKATGEPV